VEADVEKFYNAGNGAAGTRVRKAMQDLKVLAQEIRTEVTEKKNTTK
ncbi:histone H1, partial [Pedobacter sp. HMWF019]